MTELLVESLNNELKNINRQISSLQQREKEIKNRIYLTNRFKERDNEKKLLDNYLEMLKNENNITLYPPPPGSYLKFNYIDYPLVIQNYFYRETKDGNLIDNIEARGEIVSVEPFKLDSPIYNQCYQILNKKLQDRFPLELMVTSEPDKWYGTNFSVFFLSPITIKLDKDNGTAYVRFYYKP